MCHYIFKLNTWHQIRSTMPFLLSVLLVISQLALPFTIYAASSTNNYTFGSSQQLDRASVQRAQIQSRTELEKFATDQQAADQKAAKDAERIVEQEERQQQPDRRKPPASLPQQSQANVPSVASSLIWQSPTSIFASPPPMQPPASVRNATPTPLASPTTSPRCPNCHHPIPPTATFCGSCGFSLLLERSERTKVIPSSVAQRQKPQVDIPPVSPVPVQPLPIEDLKPKQPQTDQDEQIPSRVGEQLGNYKLVRLLGEGGFAEVYLGEHIHLGSHAAIKVLHSQLTSKEREEFRSEARTLVNLVHPHIVRLLDFGIEGKTPYLVMDYAPHGTLRQLYPQGTRVPLSTILAYVKQIAEALQFAHDEKLIHRDIKPENMLLGRRNEILLSDFGLAIVSQSQSSRYYGEGGKAGTAAYMSPEQFNGKPRPASDQYALGVVVYEWLCGEPPFNEGNFIQLGYQHSYVAPPPLRESLPTIPPTIEQVVHKALAKDPAQRWPSVQAFAQALEKAKEHD